MKKLISIGIALALLTMAVVPVAVAADYPDDPGAYSKTPFGVLGTGIKLIGDVVNAIPTIADMLPFDITAVTEPVGEYVGVNFAWLTDLSAWSMVLVGDVTKTALGLGVVQEFLPYDLTGVEDIFYVMGARIWDIWGTYTGTATLPDVVIDAYPPTLP